jgi:hypothetical protein
MNIQSVLCQADRQVGVESENLAWLVARPPKGVPWLRPITTRRKNELPPSFPTTVVFHQLILSKSHYLLVAEMRYLKRRRTCNRGVNALKHDLG